MSGDPSVPITSESRRRNILNRLRRLEGQARGLATMVDAGQSCDAVLTQFMAARCALDQIGLRIVGHSMRNCLAEETGGDREALVDRAFDVFTEYRAVAAGPSAVTTRPSTDRRAIVALLRDLELELRGVEALLDSDGDCDALLARLGEASRVLDEAALGLLGDSMKRCLTAAGDDSEAVLDEVIGLFLKYSSCVA